MLSRFGHVQLFATLWTVALQAPLSMGFSRQEYWSGLPFASPGDLPGLEIKPISLVSPVLAGWFFTTRATWEALYICVCRYIYMYIYTLWLRNPASNNLSQWYNGKSMQSYLPHSNKYSFLVQCCASLLGQRWIRFIFCLHISNSVRCNSLLFKANQPYSPLSNLKFP